VRLVVSPEKKINFDFFFQNVGNWKKINLIQTSKQQNMYIFGISEQFATRKSTMSIYRATSNFDLHMRIFNLQGLGAPDRPKKKNKYTEIDCTSLITAF
jgi:hypothetical protein